MAENKIYALICGLGHIEFSKNVDAEFTSPDGLIEVKPNDYNLIFIKDLSKVSTGSLYLLQTFCKIPQFHSLHLTEIESSEYPKCFINNFTNCSILLEP